MDIVEDLVVRAQVGDQEAYAALVRRFEAMAFAYAHSLLGDHDMAEDARQDAFIGAWCDLLTLRKPGSFPAWLRKIVYRQSINYVRGRRMLLVPLSEAAELPHNGLNPAEKFAQRQTRERIREAIAKLPIEEHEVVQLFYLDELSLKEISGIVGISINLVKNRLHTARARLRQRMMEMVKETVRKKQIAGDRKPASMAAMASSAAIEHFDRELRTLMQYPDQEKQLRAGELLRVRGRMQRFMGQSELALNSFKEGLAIPAVSKSPLGRARFRAELGITWAHTGEYARAARELQAARAAAQRHGGDPRLLGVIINTLGICAWGTGDYGKSLRCYQDAAKICETAKCPELEAEAQNNLALLEWKAGQLARALEKFQACLRLWKKIGNRFGQAATLVNLGIIEENLGRHIPARRHYEEALALTQELDYGQLQTAIYGNLASLALTREQWSEAAEHGQQAVKLARQFRDRRGEAIALENLALAGMKLGNARLYKDSLAAARRLARDIGDHERGLSLDLVEIEERLLRREPGELSSLIAQAQKKLEQGGYMAELPRLLRLKGEWLLAEGKAAEARKTLKKALAECRKQKNKPEEKRILALEKTSGRSESEE